MILKETCVVPHRSYNNFHERVRTTLCLFQHSLSIKLLIVFVFQIHKLGCMLIIGPWRLVPVEYMQLHFSSAADQKLAPFLPSVDIKRVDIFFSRKLEQLTLCMSIVVSSAVRSFAGVHASSGPLFLSSLDSCNGIILLVSSPHFNLRELRQTYQCSQISLISLI